MALTEKLEMLLTLDAQGAVKGFKDVGRTADRELKRADARMDKLGSGMKKAGAAMLTIGGVAAVGLWKAGQAAGDLAEAANVTGLVFEDARDEIDKFVKTSATGLGMSERAARDATTTFGGLLSNLGFAADETVAWSKDLTTLAADMASAFNTEPEDAVTALGSAMRGEQEPIRRYNVILDDAAVRTRAVEMGLAATTAAVDNNGKAQGRLSLIMEQTNKIHGDFANTADGLANSQRILNAQWEESKAAIGEAVLPLMEQMVGTTSDLLSGFSGLNEQSGGLVGQLAFMGTGFLIVGGAASILVGHMITMRKTLSGLGKAADGTLTTMGRMSRTLGGVAGAAAAGAAVWMAWQMAMDNARQAGEKFADGIEEGLKESLEGTEPGVEGLTDKMRTLTFEARNMREQITGWNPVENAELEAAADGVEDLASEMLGLVVMAERMAEKSNVSADAAANFLVEQLLLNNGFTDAGVALGAYNEEQAIAAGLAPEVVAGAAEGGDAFVDAATDIKTAEDALKDWRDAVAGAFDPLFAMADAEQGVKDANRDLAGAQDELNEAIAGGDWDAIAEAQEGVYSAERDLLEANVDLDVSARNLAHAIDEGETSFEAAAESIEGWVEQGVIAEGTAASLLAQIALLHAEAEKPITVKVAVDTSAFGQLLPSGQTLGEVLSGGNARTDINANLDARRRAAGPSSYSGGPVGGTAGMARGITAHGGEYVLSADVVQAIKRGGPSRGLDGAGSAAGGGTNLNFYGYTDDQMIKNVEDANAQMAWTTVSGRADG